MPARLTTRCRGDGEGLPASVAAKSFDGKLPTPSLLSGRFSDGRAGASRISASFILLRARRALCKADRLSFVGGQREPHVTAALRTA